YILLQNYLSGITDRWPLLMGFVFIFMVLFIPGGLSKMILTAKGYLIEKITGRGTVEEERG
ncbi:MAG TPA: hypothetical protein VLW86_11105, partial [Syntrophorhabdales bacterium]|nr:hypothetical protein [Syntrophorhabdales bacterium]